MVDSNIQAIAEKAFLAAGEHKALLKQRLRTAKAPCDLERALMDSYKAVNTTFTEHLVRSGEKIACGAGCWFCCVIKVDATPLEVFTVAEFIKRNFTQDKVQAIHEKAKANRTKIADLTAEQQVRTVIPCPLLENEKCLCYAVRPLVCRKHHSTDASVCEKMITEPENEVMRGEVAEVTYSVAPLIIVVLKAVEEEGFDATPYDFSSALDEVLSNPKSYRRWRQKKKVFNDHIKAKDWKEPDSSTPQLDN